MVEFAPGKPFGVQEIEQGNGCFEAIPSDLYFVQQCLVLAHPCPCAFDRLPMETGQPVYARGSICKTKACKKRNDGEMSENGRKKGPNRRQMGAARRK
jgi:hypothetical protein